MKRKDQIRDLWYRINKNRKLQLRVRITFALVLLFVAVLVIRGCAGRAGRRAAEEAAKASAAAESAGTGEMTGGGDAAASGNAAGGDAASGAEAAPAVTPVPVSDVSSAEEPAPKGEVTITVSAVGDVTLGKDDGMDYDVSFNAKYEEVDDPSWFLENVRDVFSTDDLTLINFEGTFTESNERADKTFAFKAPPSYVEVLTSGSVEAANLANNHSFDYGRDAYEETKKTLEDAGIISFGYDRSQVITVKGIKVGLVGIYELEQELGCKDLMLDEIRKVQEQGAQLVIVSFHWGDEGTHDLTDIQIELAHAAVDAGAHLVVGHHPHVLQGIGHYGGVYICYSLGNFCFGGNSDPADKDTMIFRQTFTFVDGKLQDTDEHLVIPCRISSTESYNNYRPTILEGEEAERVMDKINNFL